MNPKTNIDSILTYLFLKRLMLPVTQSTAYKMKLVDAGGRVIKTPETEVERDALTLLDKLCFKLKRMLGGKINLFNEFLYMQTLQNSNLNNQLIVKGGSVEQRAEIKRIMKSFEKLQEEKKMKFTDILIQVLNEELLETQQDIKLL